MNLEVSRFFEPVDRLTVEARYTFYWDQGGFSRVDLSKREDREEGYSNAQWGREEDVPIADVPDDVIDEAVERLHARARTIERLNEDHDGS